MWRRREIAAGNKGLGEFNLEGIPPSSRGTPQIEVTFDIDANGIVHVSAKDLGTGKEQKIRIESSSGLNESDIDRMVKEAEAHAEEDRREKEKAEAKNEADSLIYTTEKTLKDMGDKIGEADKSKIQEAIADLKRALEGSDVQAIKDKTETLKQASYKIAEELYKNASPQGGEGTAGASGAQGSTGENNTKSAEDVDYEVVENDKK